MDEAKRRLVLGWLAKAEDDLRVARLLITEENRLTSRQKPITGLTPPKSALRRPNPSEPITDH